MQLFAIFVARSMNRLGIVLGHFSPISGVSQVYGSGSDNFTHQYPEGNGGGKGGENKIKSSSFIY